MVNFTSRRTKDAARHGALKLALALPLLAASPALAQEGRRVDLDADPSVGAEATLPESGEEPSTQPLRVLVSEVVIDGIDDHPEQERLELAAYDAMAVRPGNRVTRDELKLDLDAIYATGWFSDVRIEPVNGPLGVKLVVRVVPNPVLTAIELGPGDAILPVSVVEDTFSADYGRTLNLNELIEIEGASVIRAEGVFHHAHGKNRVSRTELNRSQNRVRDDPNHKLDAERAVDRLDTDI